MSTATCAICRVCGGSGVIKFGNMEMPCPACIWNVCDSSIYSTVINFDP